jgi:predicted RND superfamily exporter protein
LKFFESNFGGVMPFEISIDTKKKNGVINPSTIYNINRLQREIRQIPEFTKPLSIAELVKFSKQAYKGGEPKYYSIPDGRELLDMRSYINASVKNKTNLLHSFIDSSRQFTRISVQVEDVGMKDMNRLQNKLKPKIDSIFSPEKFNVIMTGNSIVYAKGTEFLINNLIESVIIGVLIISCLMALVFTSPRIILIALIVNIIPLFITAAIMGFAMIPLKPSTLIVFSIALGISIDNAILYLAKYRYELKLCNGDITTAAIVSLKESSLSMIYTSVVFVFGFAIFIISGFGGTQALGMLISITLFVALFFNIFVLPSLLLSIDKRKKISEMKKPFIDLIDENDEPEK